MKFYTYSLFTLLSVGSALSLSVEDILLPTNVTKMMISEELIMNKHIFSRDDQVLDTVTQLQCSASLNNSNCLYKTVDPTNINLDEYCKPLKDEKCIAFYNKGASELDGCKNFPKDQLEEIDKQLKMQLTIMKALCETDEEGKECPFATFAKAAANDMSQAEKLVENEAEVNKIIYDTCRSQRCTENTRNYFIEFLDLMSEQEGLTSQDKADINKDKEEIIKTFQDKKCIEAQVLKSDASSTVKKLGTTMLISISLLLYLL